MPDFGDKNYKKKLDRQEEKLKTNSRELSMVKMQSMGAISFAFMALLSMFNSMYAILILIFECKTCIRLDLDFNYRKCFLSLNRYKCNLRNYLKFVISFD